MTKKNNRRRLRKLGVRTGRGRMAAEPAGNLAVARADGLRRGQMSAATIAVHDARPESCTPPPLGAIAQLGERLDRTQEVGGSSPPSSIARDSRPLRGFRAFVVLNHRCSTGSRPNGVDAPEVRSEN